MRKINKIIIHCSATRPDWMAGQSAEAKRDEITRWHVEERGWSDNGYHAVIDRDGTVIEGRPVERSGAHVLGHNRDSLSAVLIGGHGSSAKDDFSDHFTPEQSDALADLCHFWCDEFPEIQAIDGHNQYAAKACPGFIVEAWKQQVDLRLLASEIEPDQPGTIAEFRQKRRPLRKRRRAA